MSSGMEMFLPGNLCRLIPASAEMAGTITAQIYGQPGRALDIDPSEDRRRELVRAKPPVLILEVELYPAGMVKAYKILIEDRVRFARPEAVVRFLAEE